MAFYILINKEKENEQTAQYSFYPSELSNECDGYGLLEISKENGEVTLIKPAYSDQGKHFFMRASRKIYVHWRNGELPEKTQWVS
ncbi:hypothetical protein [Providencia sp. Me31A]|uniref:hypothetical protein n=1 Tax=Providencia sp. Me31A TaxID=3392637 RepID=UPI003D2853D9